LQVVATTVSIDNNDRRTALIAFLSRSSAMATTETRPDLADSETREGDGYAHYARKEEITRAAIEGGTITALCGFRFSPVRDPQRFPVCPRCKELAGMLWGSD
jgi:hypothetical protein